ncbi:PMEI domain-containing protein [Heracleum sosnowskyi]|uniref:PMEI domain-containing protein n=1 Tax=Heracleum sosnowskyi TaxID=360622 RepID=A0AAD8IIP0_9APIA|nr:PMEI domain-containing protein [Heracleum sosnowskyi]
MNPSMTSFFLFFALTFCITLVPCPIESARAEASASASASQNDLLTKACSLAPKKDLCQQTISSAKDNPKKDLNDLAFIAFQAASNTSASNAEFVSQTLDDVENSEEPDDAEVMQSFHDCQQQYEGMNDEVDSALSALATRAKQDDGQIETWLKDSIAAVETCQTSAKGKGLKVDQLTGMNQKLLDFLNNAMAVFQVVKQN